MRLGLQLPSFSYPGGTASLHLDLMEIAQAAEFAGFDSLWVMDHLFQLPADSGWGGPDEPMLEAYATLGFLAGATSRVSLGALVGCALFREPGLLIKTASTVDVLSGGRLTFGIGAGWYEREARGLGIEWPDRRERFARLEETLQIAHQLWRDDRSQFAGRFTTLAEPIIRPQPLSRPPPRRSWSAATANDGPCAWSPATATHATSWCWSRTRFAPSWQSCAPIARTSGGTCERSRSPRSMRSTCDRAA